MQYTMEHIAGHFNSELIDAVKQGKTFRIVGDNINFHIGITHARKSKGKASHWLGSAAIIQNLNFNHLSDQTPQCDLRTIPASGFLPQDRDLEILRADMITLVARVRTEFFPWLKFAKETANNSILGELSPCAEFKQKNKVIPLPVMAKNEQKYADVVDILDSYEMLISSVCETAEIQPVRVQIGGDQLTRERFSGAKRLRAALLSQSERFSHLSLITFELFHLQMSVLSVFFYQILYHDINTESCTLHAQKIRLMRKDADGSDVKNHYNHCKELAVSVIKAYIVEAACEHFNVSDTETVPDISLPSKTEDIPDWLNQELEPIVQKIMVERQLQNCQPHAHDSCDIISDYASLVLQIGLFYMELNDIIKVPDRDRLLAVLKVLMVVFKGHNNKSKYALEIVRFLCQQYALLSEQAAHSSLYGLFVNTGAKVNSNIPADLQMEYLVRLTKGHLKSMCSNVSDASMRKRSSAFYGMQEVCDNFDYETMVMKRAQKHKVPSAFEDEKRIAKDLRFVRPFKHVCGRRIASMRQGPKNPVRKMDKDHLSQWIEGHKFNFYYELGQ